MVDVKSKILFDQHFFDNAEDIFSFLVENVEWDASMRARMTARFGQPNIGSEQVDMYKPFFPVMNELADRLAPLLGYRPNNCFLNYYENGNSKMGWHGDSTHFLEPETGIAILSVGDTRVFQVRRKAVPTEMLNYILIPGSLIYSPISIQEDWQHAIPKVVSDKGRISMTFRKMKTK